MKGKFSIGSFVSMPTNNESNNKIRISIHDIKNNPMNFYRVKDIEAMAKRLTFAPDMDRISVFEDGDKYMLCSGHKRVAALLYGLAQGYEFSSEIIKDDMIEVTLKDFEKEERDLGKGIFTKEDFQILDLILPNKGQRRNLSVAEEATEIKYLEPVLKKEYDHKKAQGELSGVKWRTYFADIMEMSETRLQRFIDYRKLSPEIQNAIEDGQIKFTAAIDMANLSHDEQNKIILGLQDQGTELTGKAVKEERAKVEEKVNPPKLPKAQASNNATTDRKDNHEAEVLDRLEEDGQLVLPNTYPPTVSPEQTDVSNAQLEGEIEIHPLDIPEAYGKLSVILLKKDNGYVAGFRFEHAEELAEEIPEEDDIAKSSKEEVIQDEILFLEKYGTQKVKEALAAGGYIEEVASAEVPDPAHEESKSTQQSNPFKEIKDSIRNRIVRVELARDEVQLKEQLSALRNYIDETIEKMTD